MSPRPYARRDRHRRHARGQARATAPAELDVATARRRCGSSAPGRPAELAIVPGATRACRRSPGMRDPAQRARILHALANHELQAIELFAWALLAFPDAPARVSPRPRRDPRRRAAPPRALPRAARRARHARSATIRSPDTSGTSSITSPAPLEFVCAMGLTFENANLDFAGDYAAAARACGDTATADALDAGPRRRDPPRPLRVGLAAPARRRRMPNRSTRGRPTSRTSSSRSARRARAAPGSIATRAGAPASTRRSSTRSPRSRRRGRAAQPR